MEEVLQLIPNCQYDEMEIGTENDHRYEIFGPFTGHFDRGHYLPPRPHVN